MIYLDNAATSWPKAPHMAQACEHIFMHPIGNVGRSAHEGSITASRILYDCRKTLQDIIPPTHIEKIIFTKNATEALNIALFGFLAPGDTVITTPIEHNAVARPLSVLASRHVKILFSPVDGYGKIDIDGFSKLLDAERPRLAVFTVAGNVSGVINPVEELVASCASRDIPFVLDGAQAVGEIALSGFGEGASGALCFSLHKGLLGPTGVGVMALYGNFNPRALVYGGTGSNSDATMQPEILPDKFESGTLPIHSVAIGLHALRYCVEHADTISRQRNITSDLLWEGLASLKQLRMISPREDRVGLVSVTTKETTISCIARYLFSHQVAIRSGLHCAPWAHKHFNTLAQGGALRFSVGYATTTEEVLKVIDLVKEAMNG
ncbi:MAG: aminotransferase class V-fold PLP-dependent enzyme [Sphaerochaetaceae bacterium]|jgi:selenocysteine lyase/cysteine desulfurase|nr:aminotransferase class V-fold PLP-dependent enzyme [Sphaerochaetaceae bacterium]NLO61191.1 aminotransferase class V-fold PLP-dependent enzyme [Spirochaetales bacterium]MDD3671704.1 aminotransferase class V-fold PLP-dependent enzyme [Sphaerochaetaceae bacterium]MDD4259446.1 aminotransferase class V-fold PLP-dependent enzyme [Sphaerochaetaceae bacterium]MDD4762454.1 aminotransferase class V-fold PLP-dependent enzyme [Sphaerochaetaceae bacterium]